MTGTEFLALSLVDAGYEVYANTEASGTFDVRLANDANRRMEKAGVTLMSMFGIVCDLMRDWRNTPGFDQVLPFLDKQVLSIPRIIEAYTNIECRYQFAYGLLARQYAGAVQNGTLLAPEAALINN